MYSAPLSNPRPKRSRTGEVLQQPFPVPVASLTGIKASNAIWRWYKGRLVDDAVIIEEPEEGRTLGRMGFFGEAIKKGDKYAFVSLEDFEPKKRSNCEIGETMSDEDNEEGQSEKVSLNLCEAFFLSYALGCLLVIDDVHAEGLSVDEMWDIFCAKEVNFPYHYAVYHHFRAKGWVVKPGTKFGCDFLLYKHGPPFFHASFSVLVEVEDGREDLSWRDLAGLNRVTESAAKELLLVRVHSEESNQGTRSPEVLKLLFIKEVLVRRWVPSQEREENLSILA